MNTSGGGHRTQITIAMIGLAGVVATGLFANWDKIFRDSDPATVAVTPQAQPEGVANENSRYTIYIYYFPKREKDSAAITKRLRDLGYIVNRTSATEENKKDENQKSFLYYRKNNADVAASIVKSVTAELGEDVNSYVAAEDRALDEIRIVLTHGKCVQPTDCS